jgi:adenosylcobinamide-GDP ribazoletransferase
MDEDGIAQAAEFMPIFPIVGAFVGLVSGVATWSLELVLPSSVVGVLGLGVILLLNGVQHVDGLLDFGDGIMCHGSRDRKLRIMRDPATGAGGFSIGLVVLLATAFAIADISRNMVIQAIVASEAAAKFSMVFEAWKGTSAHKGMSTPFVSAMHLRNRNWRLALSILLLILVVVGTLGVVGLGVVSISVIATLIVVTGSNRAFGGITGDVLGATNELTRLASLLILLAVMR